jgi:hypothetical protein
MKTPITPYGTVVEIQHKTTIYFGLLVVDFNRFKTFGNTDIDPDLFVFFDENFKLIPFVRPLYKILSERMVEIVLNEKSYDDKEWGVD